MDDKEKKEILDLMRQELPKMIDESFSKKLKKELELIFGRTIIQLRTFFITQIK